MSRPGQEAPAVVTDASPQTLREAFNFTLSELWSYDLKWGLVGGVAAGVTSGFFPKAFADALPMSAGFIGVVIGSVIAVAALQVAFLDTQFLQRLELIEREPVHYLAPALFSAFLGVVAALLLIVAAVITAVEAPAAVRIPLHSAAGWFTVWAIVSVLPTLRMMVGFVALKRAAASIHLDDIARIDQETHRSQRG